MTPISSRIRKLNYTGDFAAVSVLHGSQGMWIGHDGVNEMRHYSNISESSVKNKRN